MQTFLPFSDFHQTAEILDPRRLGKQRVEAVQVLRALSVPGYGWQHHPVVTMWSGYEEALCRYGLDICSAWTRTGRLDTCASTLRADFARYLGPTTIRTQAKLAEAEELPPWLGDQSFHRSHQSVLVQKDEEFYRPCFVDVPGDLAYVWPKSDRPRTVPCEGSSR